MTQVYQLGLGLDFPEKDKQNSLSPVIQKILFKWDHLKQVLSELQQNEQPNSEGIQPIFHQMNYYYNMVSHIKDQDLCFRKVVCSKQTVFLIDDKDELWTYGRGLMGQLGTQQMKIQRAPFNITRYQDQHFLDVTCSDTHTMAISGKFKLFCWGEQKWGTLGIKFNDEDYIDEPQKIKKNAFKKFFTEEENKQLKKFTHLSAGNNYSLAICNNKLFSFGKEEKGRLGLGQKNLDFTESPQQIIFPVKINQIQGMSTGLNHALCWDSEGKVFSWGNGNDGKLGHASVNGKYKYQVLAPTIIKAFQNESIVQGSCGDKHSCILTSKGQVFTFGRSIYNRSQKKLEVGVDYLRPKKLGMYTKTGKSSEMDTFILKIYSQGYQNGAIDKHGFLFTWGENSKNCLGHEESKDFNNPVCVEQLTKYSVIDIAMNQYFSVVIVGKQDNKISYNAIKQFNNKIIDNAKDSIKKIKSYNEQKQVQLYIKRTQEQGGQVQITSQSEVEHKKRMSESGFYIYQQLKQKGNNLIYQNQKQPYFVKEDQKTLLNKQLSKQPKLHKKNFSEADIKKSKVASSIKQEIQDEFVKVEVERQQINRNLQKFNKQQMENLGQKEIIEWKQQEKFGSYMKKNYINSVCQKEVKAPYFNYDGKKLDIDTVSTTLNIEADFQFVQEEKKELENKYIGNKKEELKGIMVGDIFQQEIDQIYEDYKHENQYKQKQFSVLTNQRSKEDPFLKNRQQIPAEIRDLFNESKQSFNFTQDTSQMNNTGTNNFTQNNSIQSPLQSRIQSAKIGNSRSNSSFGMMKKLQNMFKSPQINSIQSPIYSPQIQSHFQSPEKQQQIAMYSSQQTIQQMNNSQQSYNSMTSGNFQTFQSRKSNKNLTQISVTSNNYMNDSKISQTRKQKQQMILQQQLQQKQQQTQNNKQQNKSYIHPQDENFINSYIQLQNQKNKQSTNTFNNESIISTAMVQKQEQLNQIFLERELKLEKAKLRKQILEKQKENDRQIKKQQIFERSDEYQQLLQQRYKQQRVADSQRLNWFVFLNSHSFLYSLKKLSKDLLKYKRQTFNYERKIKIVQHHIRRYLARKKINSMPPHQKMVVEWMIFKWMMRRKIKYKQKSVKKIRQFIILQNLKKKIFMGIQIYRQQIIKTQQFFVQAHNIILNQKKELEEVFDSHLLQCAKVGGQPGKRIDEKNIEIYQALLQQLSLKPINKRNFQDSASILNKLEELENKFKKRKNYGPKLTQYYLTKQQEQKNEIQNDNQKDIDQDKEIQIMIAKKADDSSKFGHFMQNLKFNNINANQIGNTNFVPIQESLQATPKTRSRVPSQIKISISQNTNQNNLIEDQIIEKQQNNNVNRSKVSFLQDKPLDLNHIQQETVKSKDEAVQPSQSPKNIKNPQAKQRMSRKSYMPTVQLKEKKKIVVNFQFNRQVLPYSVHCDLITLPPVYHISTQRDQIKKTLKSFKMTCESEILVKKEIIDLLYMNRIQNFKLRQEQHNKEFEDFIEANKIKINQQRAKYLLSTPIDTLRQIHKREELLQNIQHDHLPFNELKQTIAMKLQNAPKPPKFQIYFDENEFRHYMKIYANKLNEQFKRLEAQGAFQIQFSQSTFQNNKNNKTKKPKNRKSKTIENNQNNFLSIQSNPSQTQNTQQSQI